MHVRPLKLGEISRLTFSMILKKSYLEGAFYVFHPDPQLVQIFKYTRNFSAFIKIYLKYPNTPKLSDANVKRQGYTFALFWGEGVTFHVVA